MLEHISEKKLRSGPLHSIHNHLFNQPQPTNQFFSYCFFYLTTIAAFVAQYTHITTPLCGITQWR